MEPLPHSAPSLGTPFHTWSEQKTLELYRTGRKGRGGSWIIELSRSCVVCYVGHIDIGGEGVPSNVSWTFPLLYLGTLVNWEGLSNIMTRERSGGSHFTM